MERRCAISPVNFHRHSNANAGRARIALAFLTAAAWWGVAGCQTVDPLTSPAPAAAASDAAAGGAAAKAPSNNAMRTINPSVWDQSDFTTAEIPRQLTLLGSDIDG